MSDFGLRYSNKFTGKSPLDWLPPTLLAIEFLLLQFVRVKFLILIGLISESLSSRFSLSSLVSDFLNPFSTFSEFLGPGSSSIPPDWQLNLAFSALVGLS
jgi:hypothetical protein